MRAGMFWASATLVAVAVSGCSGGGSGAGGHSSDTPRPSSSVKSTPTAAGTSATAPSTRASAATVASGTGLPADAFVHLPAFTGPAVTVWGQASVQAAYREAVEFTFREGWDSAAMRSTDTHWRLATYSRGLASFTRSAAADVRRRILAAESGNRRDREILESWRYTAVHGPNGSTVVAGADGVTDRSFTGARAGVDRSTGSRRLSRASATLHLANNNGRRYTVRTHRKMTFWLVPNTGPDSSTKPWLIDGLYSYQSSDKAS